MKSIVYQFIKQRIDPQKPILIGLSGGPDSIALLHLLLEIQEALQLKIGIAHIDHRWRVSSSKEACQLEQLAVSLNLPFHLKVLNPEKLKGNLEEACRYERLNFFKELTKKEGYQAVLLGHHADDQTETVLKKIFEGCELPSLAGMQNAASYDGLNIWRPLLSIRKNEILNWLDSKNLTFFEDSTNQDERFLRGKFRKTIIPSLSSHFGKEISSCLNRIGSDADELSLYMNDNIQDYLSDVVEGPFGLMLDLSKRRPQFEFEFRYLIRQFCEMGEVSLSRALIDAVVDMLDSGVANKEIRNKDSVLKIDRHRLFLLQKPIPISERTLDLMPGVFEYGVWRVEVKVVENSELMPPSNWLSAWQGKAHVFLPEVQYQLVPPQLNSIYGSCQLRKWWGNEKVPAFLRTLLPIVSKGNSIQHEFLTGRLKQSKLPFMDSCVLACVINLE